MAISQVTLKVAIQGPWPVFKGLCLRGFSPISGAWVAPVWAGMRFEGAIYVDSKSHGVK